MEPPIGYGLAYRSIFPESHFRTTTGSDFSHAGGHGSLRELGSAPPARLAMSNQILGSYCRRSINSARSLAL